MGIFRRREPEKRAYNDVINQALVRAASGNLGQDPSAIGALETAAGAYARALSVAEIQGTDYVSRRMLASWARNLIRHGEVITLIDVSDSGRVELLPCHGADVKGGPSESTWRYRVDLPGPSGTQSRRAESSEVIHLRYATDPAQPWRGKSPLAFASATGELAAALEDYFASEACAAHGHLLPIPQTSDENIRRLKSDLKRLRGRTAVTETSADAYGTGKPGAPPGDYRPQRIGPNPPASLQLVHTAIFDFVLSTCGFPADLVADRGASGQRESWRRFLHGSAQPMADTIAEELSAKLDRPVSINLDRLFASDIQGRARAFHSMVQGGIEIDRAARLTGLDE